MDATDDAAALRFRRGRAPQLRLSRAFFIALVAVTLPPMSNNKLAELLTESLPPGSPGLFNPWRDTCDEDLPHNGPDAKLARLAAHLNCVPRFILCGEAAGYQGCRYSGIAFTSERLLLEGRIPRISPMSHRLTSRDLPYSEPSATIVWEALYNLGIEERTILSGTRFPCILTNRGKERNPNRTPKSDEFRFGEEEALRMLIVEFPKAKIIAVGKKAEKALKKMGIPGEEYEHVRHPANGGAPAFREKLRRMAR